MDRFKRVGSGQFSEPFYDREIRINCAEFIQDHNEFRQRIGIRYFARVYSSFATSLARKRVLTSG
jgi:hypothetical protein